MCNTLCCVGQRIWDTTTPFLAGTVIFILGIQIQFSAGITGRNQIPSVGLRKGLPTSGPVFLLPASHVSLLRIHVTANTKHNYIYNHTNI